MKFTLFCILTTISCCFMQPQSNAGSSGANNEVADAATAIQIAEQALFPIYGEEKIKQEKPYKVELRQGVWIVQGSVPRGAKGGAFFVRISKESGKVLELKHYR